MKILILGKNGQVGWELQRALQPLGEVIALDRTSDDGLCGDVCDFEAMQHVMNVLCPDVVVNATAYTAVDKAESEQQQADCVNHLAVAHLAKLCVIQDALLIHYSTDYVFSGEGQTPWRESDATSPVNYYGLSKRKGEEALENSLVRFINFRTSWVYATHGNNFIKTMLKLAQSKDELNIITDQIGAPTSAALIADITAQAIRYYQLNKDQQPTLHGHYHLVAKGETSWFAYAQFIFATARKLGLILQVRQVNAITTAAYPTPAKRPLNSRLNTQKLQHTFQIHLPTWQIGVEQVIGEIIT